MRLTSWLSALKMFGINKPARRRGAQQQAAHTVNLVEQLEDRTLLSTFHVALTGDDSTGDGSTAAPYRTVQAAINAAAAASDGNDLINVGAGLYNTFDVDGKWSIPNDADITNLTIWGGWDAGFTTRTPQTTIYQPDYTGAPTLGSQGDIDIVAANTTIDGFYFVFDGNGVGGTGGTRISGGLVVQNTGITINNNTIEIGGNPNSGARSTGIQVSSADSANLKISDNTLLADGASRANGIFLAPGPGVNTQIIGNTISGSSYATMITLNQRGDVLIANNTLQRSGPATTFQAISVRGSTTPAAPITGLVISGNTIDGGGTGTGIHISSIANAVQAITGFVIENNVISNHVGSAGIVIGTGPTQENAISGTIAYNSIVGNSVGLAATTLGAGSNAIDASRNWWGDVSGPTVATNSGGLGQSVADIAGISYKPWLIYSPDTNPGLAGVQLPTTVTVTPGGDISAADNDFTRLQNAVGAAAAGQTIDIQGTYNWTSANSSAAYTASVNTSASADIRGVEIPANLSNLTITSSDTSAHILSLGDFGLNVFDAFLFADDGPNTGNTNLVIEKLNIDDFESAVVLGWNNTGTFAGTRIRNNQVTIGGDDEGTQNIAFYLSQGNDQQLTGNTVTFQGDGTRVVGSGARSFGFQNSTTGGTGYDNLLIDNNIFQLGATSTGVEIVTGIWENGHNDDNNSDISITNNQFLGRQGVDDFDRGLQLTSQTTGLIVDGNIFTDVDNVFFARDAAGGTDPGDRFTISNSVLTRVGGADGVFLRNVTTDAVPVHVVINWNINNTIDGFTGVRGLNELSVQATGASRPNSGASDLDAVNAIGVVTDVFVDDDWSAAPRFSDPDGIGVGAGPVAAGFNAFTTITEGIDTVQAGGTVNVLAGTYAENLLINKSLSLLGPNAAIDPNTGVRSGEAVLLPAVTETSLQGSTSGVIVRVGSGTGHVDATISGFTIDGHNAALTGGRLLNGVEVHTGAGIANSIGSFDSNPGGYDVTLDVQNNVIQNLERYGVLIDNVAARTPSAGNIVSHNQIDNLPSGNNFGGGRGRAAAFEENVYGTFSYNVVTRVNVGWQDDNYNLASPGAGTLIEFNTISTYHRGIFHNLQYQSATPITISNNTISAETNGDFPASTTNFGIELASIAGAVGATVTDNDVTGNVYGILLWGLSTTAPIDVSGGTLTGNQYGIYVTSVDPQFGAASGTTQATISDVTIVDSAIAGIVLDNSTNIAPVALTIGSGNTVTGGPTGLLLDGPNLSITGNDLNDLSFAGQTGDYITLADGAFDNQTLDATAVTFDGLLPSQMTPAELFALEDKIYHEVDDNSLGLVLTTPGVYFVSPTTNPTPTDNDYTRLANIMALIASGDTVTLSGTFDWSEANAAASWALGNDGLVNTGDDYSLLAPANLNNVTWTAASLGAARIQGPGDLAGANLEGVFYFDGGDNQNWTISNLEIFDFDLSIGFFFGAGGSDAYNGTTITNNSIRVPADLNALVAPIDVNQNIGIHFSFGTNQTISNNTIEIVGSGISSGANFSSSVGMQSNTSGGAVYDGLLIDNNTINVTGTLAAEPSTVLGIWENSAGHTSDITVSNNDFVNQTGANAATNLMRAFRVTSHSSATTTVAYTGNTVNGASVGFQWITGSNFAGNQPVQLTNNIITDTQTGVLVQSNGLANLTGNIIDGVDGTSIGVDVVAGSVVTLFRNDISGTNIGVNNSGTLTSVTENFIRNNSGDGLRVNAGAQVTGLVFNNNLSGNAGFGIDNQTAALVDASSNFYGVSTAAGVAAEISGNVDYSPWLDLGIDTNVGVAGFQGDFSSLGVDDDSPQSGATAHLQEALNLLANGSLVGGARTVHVAAGTYAEALNLNVPLTLQLLGNASIDSIDTVAGTIIDLQSNTLTVGATSANNTFAGVVQGTGGSLTKVGTGTLTLAGANTYTGTTIVAAGTLLVNGSTTSDTIVNGSATLGGDGSIDGSVTVDSSGVLTPGNSAGTPSTGILDTGDLVLSNGSVFTVEVNGRIAGTQTDRVAVQGTVDISGATLVATGTVTSFAGQVITLISNDGVDPVVGTFAGLPEGSTVTVNGVDFTLSYQGGTGNNDVTLTEAGVVAMIGDVSVDEAAGVMNFIVTLSSALDIDVTINVTFTDITATGGVDYNDSLRQVTIPAGQTSGQISVPIIEDNIVEGSETFTAHLSNGSDLGGRAVDFSDTGIGTITDNDTATVSISATVDGAEGAVPTNGQFTVTLSAPSSSDTVVNYSVTGTATPGTGNDFTTLSGSVTIPAGQTSANIDVTVLDDTIVEGTETVIVTLDSVGASDPDVGLDPNSANLTATIEIADDDTNTLTISSPTVTEGNAGTTTLTFTVTSPNAVQGGFTVDFTVADITTNGSDYTVVTTSPLTFAGTAGEIQTIVINVVGDTIVEADETLTVTLGTVTPVAPVVASSIVSGAVGTGTITNDDTTTLTISSPTVVEGNAGTTTLTFTVTSSNAVAGGFTVDFSVADITTNGADYSVISTSPLTFAGNAGETQTITIEVNGDTIVEGDETLEVTLGTATPVAPVAAASIVSGAIGTGTITNDDTSTLTISSPTVTEGDAGTTTLTFTVTSPSAVEGGFTVDFTVAGITAAGTDYTVVTTSPLTFTGTAGEVHTIVVNVIGDTLVEADETLSVTLGTVTPIAPVTAASITSGAVGTGTILDDDLATVSIAKINDGAESATPTNGKFTVTLSAASSTDTVITYNVSGTATSGAGNDYVALTGTVTILAGQTSADIDVFVLNDAIVEGLETVVVTLTGISSGDSGIMLDVTPSNLAATVNITDDDTNTLTISSPTVTEGNAGTTTLTFDVTSPNAVQGGFTVAFSVLNITTSAGDYTVVTNSPLTFAGTAGEIQTITVTVNGDTIVEGNESFTVTLGTVTPVAPVSAASIVSGAVGTGTILNDDTNTLTISSPTVTEGDAGTTTLTFNVTSPSAVEGGFTVAFNVANLTANSSDYTVVTTSPLTFTGAAGEIQTIVVNVNGDTELEADETFSVTLGAVTPVSPVLAGSIVSGAVGTGTIINDDGATVSITKITDGTESNTPTNGKFRVTLTGVSTTDTVVTYTVSGTATPGAGNDYTTLSGTVTIPAGQLSADIDVTVLNDAIVEATETVVVTLTGFGPHDPNITLDADPSDITATVNITDDDAANFTINNVSVAEGGGALVLDLTTDKALDIDVTITVTFTDVTATGGGTDYTSTTQQITFLAGQTSQQVSVAINDDNIVELAETFTASLSTSTAVGNRVIITSDTGTGTITDNDTATFTIDDVSVSESAGTLVFTVVIDKALDTDVTVTVTFTDVSATGGGTDYASITQQITFLAGQTSKQVSVAITNDAILEGTETFTATLSTATPLNGRPVTVSDVGTGTIIDDDSATVSIVKITDGAETDTPTNGKFRVILSAASTTDTIVTYTVGGTAGPGQDYSTLSGTVTIPAGQTTADIDVNVIGDNLPEDTETVIVTLTGFTAHDPAVTLDSNPSSLTATVNIVDDDTVVIISPATVSVPENTSTSTVVLDVNANAVAGHTLTYSLSGPDKDRFVINSLTGEITFAMVPDFEAPIDQGGDNTYNITVNVTADFTPSRTTSQNVTITVTPVNDNDPTFGNASPSFSISENATAGTVVGTVAASDADLPPQSLTYSIISGNDSGAFAIDPVTGQITVVSSTPLDFETASSFTLNVRVTDNGSPNARTADAVVVINLTNILEEPTISVPSQQGTYHIGDDPLAVFAGSTLTYGEVANPDFSNAILTASIVAGRSRRDTLSIFPKGEGPGAIHVKGRKVFYGDEQIGTFKGGRGNRHPNLVVTLNGNATLQSVENLIQRVSIRARKDAGTTRTVNLQVTNIGGVDSNVATRNIIVVVEG